jgi:undecaprenyl-diphosphatase
MTLINVFILSLIEGLTEFLPISSTGHLIIASAYLKIEPTDFSKAFDIIIQFGAIFAVVFLYRDRLKWDLAFYKKVFIAFLPAAFFGFLLKHRIDELLESTVVVAWALIVGGVILLFVDSLFNKNSETELTNKKSGIIGLFQCLALIPGVSRSAATIIGGQVVGLSRAKAAEFSFILAIPTLGAATVYKLWKIRDILNASQSVNLALGTFLSFVFAIFAIKLFVSFINKYGLKYFGIYRIILGAIVLYMNSKGQL